MAYAVKADLMPRRLTSDELAQLTDDNLGTTTVDAVVTDILAEASAQIDSYCRLQYTVPLQASDQIKGLCLDIAVYRLFERRRRISPDVLTAYQNAIAFLKDVSAGKAGLDQPVNAVAQSGSGDAVPTAQTQIFSDDNLKGFA